MDVIRVALFDIDGTLIRTGGAGVTAFERAFESEFGVAKAVEHIDFAGRTDSSIVREAFNLHGIEFVPANWNGFLRGYLHWLEILLPEHDGAPCPGVVALLETLAQLPNPPLMGLLTGNVRRGAELKLDHYELGDWFTTGAFGDDHEDRNELARIAQQRASDILGLAVPGREILVVGDTPHDIACAHAIEAQVLAVATGRHTIADLQACRPTWVLETLERVEAENLWS